MKKIIIALISILIFGLAQCVTLAQDQDINQDIYFIAYVNRLENKIKSNWITPHGKIDKKAVIIFEVDKNGKISNISLSYPSGDKEFDEIALSAVSASSPLEAFPETIKNDKIKMEFTFCQDDIEANPIFKQTGTIVLRGNLYENSPPLMPEYNTETNKQNKLKKVKIKKTNTKIKKVYPYSNCPQSYNAGIRPKTVAAAAVSLLIWPGLGQLMNDAPMEKVQTHAILGIIDIFRLWSCYDALVDRKGGVWDDRI